MSGMQGKLRQIYDALDECDYKKVLQLTKANKKDDNKSPLVKALRAIALQRSGSSGEAMVMLTVLCECPFTSNLLLTSRTPGHHP